MKYFKKLVGERIYLSPVNIEDVEKYVEWFCDFTMTDGVGRSGEVMTIKGEKEYLENATNNKLFIGDENNRSKGYGKEILKLLLDYGFNYLNLNNIMLTVKSFNERAINCYQKVGFKEIGRRRKSYFLNGKYYDDIYMDILAEEFKESYIRNKNI